MNPSFAQNVATQFFLSTPYQITKPSRCASTNSNIIQWKDQENDHDNPLSLKPSTNLEHLVNQFDNATSENSNDPERLSSSKYYDIEEMYNIDILH